MTKQPLYDLIGAGIVSQVNCYGRMAKLMNGKPQARCVFNPVGNLTAEHVGAVFGPRSPRETEVQIRSAYQVRPILMNIFVDQRG